MADITGRIPAHALAAPHRADFHILILITTGEGRHEIDFASHPCWPGILLWVRPGQAHRFHQPGSLDGKVVLFTADFPPDLGSAEPRLTNWLAASRWAPARPDLTAISTTIDQIAAERAAFAHAMPVALLRHLLAVLLLRIDRLPTEDDRRVDSATAELFGRFQAELERSYAITRSAEHYAARLGYTVKHLTRACIAAAGHPAKHLIDARVILEAKRLLAYTEVPVADIGRRLGFIDPTNFGKFFARHTHTTPGAFRRTQKASG
ncbi:AraC family transcriptional regulator [Nonomuraea guangzhouensis]|uniref:AraC family transcriptional regulator n=1 Tax=Nonomuraea guangzhouensis TaxID=1291555 RepID=A0ABW4FZ28_9ACTN|nr:helix-turn-helix transcriptional regulator [Nonomuraea guangzhouensis]